MPVLAGAYVLFDAISNNKIQQTTSMTMASGTGHTKTYKMTYAPNEDIRAVLSEYPLRKIWEAKIQRFYKVPNNLRRRAG